MESQLILDTEKNFKTLWRQLKQEIFMGFVGDLIGGIVDSLLGTDITGQKADARRQQERAQQQSYELQAKAQSQAEQDSNRANAQRVNAGAILNQVTGAQDTGILTSGSGVDPDSLNLGTAATLGAQSTLGTQSTLGRKTKLGRMADDNLLY